MKVERVKIADLLIILSSYLKEGAEFIDIKIVEGENTIRIKPSEEVKKLPKPKDEGDTNDTNQLKEPI